MPNNTPITSDMIIQDVLDNYPKERFFLINAFLEVGLRCVGCGSANHESIAQGAKVHGFDDEKISTLVANLNRVLEGLGVEIEGDLNITIDENAAEELRKSMEAQNMVGAKLRLSINPSEDGRASYGMRLVDTPQEGDYELLSQGIPLYICRMSASLLNNTKIIYDSGPDGSGFRFEKQQAC